ncbi:hypothetical protein ACFQMM_02990 [Saliphagus sp. GCM10025308]
MSAFRTHSVRPLLALSLGAFGVSGLVTAGTASLEPTTLETTLGAALAVVGVYGVACYARRVSRPTLARLSIGLWLAFIAIAALHLPGLEATGAALPAPTGGIVAGFTALTWATLVGAASTTTFLAFQEYNAGTDAIPAEESVVDQDYDY